MQLMRQFVCLCQHFFSLPSPTAESHIPLDAQKYLKRTELQKPKNFNYQDDDYKSTMKIY